MSLESIQSTGQVFETSSPRKLDNTQNQQTESIELFPNSKKYKKDPNLEKISKHQYKLLLKKEIESIKKSNESNSEPIPEKYIKELAEENLSKKYTIMGIKDSNRWYKDKVDELIKQNPEMTRKDAKKLAAKAYEEKFGEVLPKDKPQRALMGGQFMITGGIPIMNPLNIYSGIKAVAKIKHQNEVKKDYDKNFEEANKPHGVVEIGDLDSYIETTDENGNKVEIILGSDGLPFESTTYSKDETIISFTTYDRKKNPNGEIQITGGETIYYDSNEKINKSVEFEFDENGKFKITDVMEY